MGTAAGPAWAQVDTPSALDATQGSFGAPTLDAAPAGGGLRGTGADFGGGTTFTGPQSDASPGQAETDLDQDTARQRTTLRSTIRPPETSTAKTRVGAPKLPDLAPYPRPVRLRDSLAGTDPSLELATPVPAAAPTVAALPVPPPLRRPKEDPTPFAPLGYTIGTLRLSPYVEESLGYDSNPDQIATKVKPSAFSRTEGGFDLLSLWSSNQLKATMHGGYDEFFSNPGANRPDGSGVVDYRYDVTRDLALDAEGRFLVTTQRPGSPEVNAAVIGRPLVTSYGATLGGSDTLGRFTLGLHGLFDRTQYDNGRLGDGTTVLLDDQTYNDYGINGRLEYELLPTIKPFVDLTVDERIHDRHLDYSGFARDSDGVLGRVGSSFELGPLLTGTVAAGYEDRSYQDRRLKDLQGPVVDGTLIYAMTPLTTLTLTASTSFNETDLAGSSGSESRAVAFQVSHALLRNLTLSAIVGYLNTDYIGSSIVENTYSGTLKASYNISRSVVLDATYNHETLHSTAPSSSFTQDVFLVGLRLQH